MWNSTQNVWNNCVEWGGQKMCGIDDCMRFWSTSVIFKKLETPNEKQEDIYKTELILGKSHRIGKNYKGLPSILINTKKNNDSATP